MLSLYNTRVPLTYVFVSLFVSIVFFYMRAQVLSGVLHCRINTLRPCTMTKRSNCGICLTNRTIVWLKNAKTMDQHMSCPIPVVFIVTTT